MDATLRRSDEDVTRILSQDAWSISLEDLGVKRAYGAQMPSNSPYEDHYNRPQAVPLWQDENLFGIAILMVITGARLQNASRELLRAVQAKLNTLEPESRTDESIKHAVEAMFTEADNAIIKIHVERARNKEMALEEKVPYMEVARRGPCTGNSRAVLGQQDPDGTWQTLRLSEDQTGASESEAARLGAEHPNEEAVVKDGRVLGLGIPRAFGNFRFKSTYEDQDEFGMRYLHGGAVKKDDIPTPPYIIARPVATGTKLEDDRAFFVVLASGGVWDNRENYEVVDLVVRWLEALPESALERMGMKVRVTPDTVWCKKEPQPPANSAAL